MQYAIKLYYHGTEFHGWQVQPNAHSIQAEIEHALSLLCKEKIDVVGNGRTDTGVHAKNYVAHFYTQIHISNAKHFLFQLNAILPKSIMIEKICMVPDNFHARFSATSRTYKYFVTQHKNPFLTDRALFYPYDLDIEMMNIAAQRLLTVDDFTSFAKLHSDVTSNICKVYESFWEKKNDQLIFTITANRFLRNMVRSVVGTMLWIGRKKLTLSDLETIIDAKNRSQAGTSVASHGLFFWNVSYPDIEI